MLDAKAELISKRNYLTRAVICDHLFHVNTTISHIKSLIQIEYFKVKYVLLFVF